MKNHPIQKADTSVVDWLNCIWLTDLPSNAKFIACYLRKFMNSQRDIAYPSYARMIKETGLSRGCLAKYLALLESEGWIVRDKTIGLNTTYIAVLPKQLSEGLTSSLNKLVHEMNYPSSPDEQVLVHEMNTNKQCNNQSNKQVTDSSDLKSPRIKIVEQVIDYYHEILTTMPKIKKVTKTRIASVNARHKEDLNNNIENWPDYFNYIKDNCTWMLDPKYGINFDYLINQTNYVKILEGTKNDR